MYVTIDHQYHLINHWNTTLKSELKTPCVIRFSPLQQQIVQYLKDMFDHDKVRFTSAQCLAEDILNLSHRRSEILLGYLGIDNLLELNGALPCGDTDGSTGPN